MTEIELKPKCVFDCFAKVNTIPRPSKKEEQMISFLVDLVWRQIAMRSVTSLFASLQHQVWRIVRFLSFKVTWIWFARRIRM